MGINVDTSGAAPPSYSLQSRYYLTVSVTGIQLWQYSIETRHAEFRIVEGFAFRDGDTVDPPYYKSCTAPRTFYLANYGILVF